MGACTELERRACQACEERGLGTRESRGQRGRQEGKWIETPGVEPGALKVVLALKARGWSSPPADFIHSLFDPL